MRSCHPAFWTGRLQRTSRSSRLPLFALISQAFGGRAPLLVTDFADPLTIARHACLFLRREGSSALPVKVPCMERNRSRANDRLSLDFFDSRASHPRNEI